MIQEDHSKILKFLQIKEEDLISWGEPIRQNNWIIWSPLLYLNFKSFGFFSLFQFQKEWSNY